MIKMVQILETCFSGKNATKTDQKHILTHTCTGKHEKQMNGWHSIPGNLHSEIRNEIQTYVP